jgi:starch synthase
VVDGETGFLVALKQYGESPFEALEPEQFARDLAEKINLLVRDPELRKRFGQAGRKRAVEKFSWHAIALETQKMYAELIERHQQHTAG